MMDDSSDHDEEFSLLQAIAQAADLCRKPLRHAARFGGDGPNSIGDHSDCLVLIEARDSDGARQPTMDLELEIYRSGDALHFMLALGSDPDAPLLWHGNHPVWMEPRSGERIERPPAGAPLEALCRRLKAVLDLDS